MIPSIFDLHQIAYFSDLDFHFAKTMGDIGNEADPWVLLAAGVASHVTSLGQVCAQLGRLGGQPIPVNDEGSHEDWRWPSKDAWRAKLAVSPLVGNGEVLTPLVLADERLYLYRYWDYERRLADALIQRCLAPVDDVDPILLEDSLQRLFAGDTDALLLQGQAARIALGGHVTMISGGPGTGKTSTVVRMMAALVEQRLSRGEALPRIALAAPTGRAASRIAETIRLAKAGTGNMRLDCQEAVTAAIPDEATTIHRLLKRLPGNALAFRHTQDNPLPVDVVVVDEASMVDLALMTKLVEAMPTHARLMLLGDRDQLASVEAGSVFAEMTLPNRVVHLTHNFRFGTTGRIGRLATAIRENRVDDVLSMLVNDSDNEEVRLITVDNLQGLDALLTPMMAERFVSEAAEDGVMSQLEGLSKSRILCAHRVGSFGQVSVNGLVERILHREKRLHTDSQWYSGRPIVVTANDYVENLFNGDTGIIEGTIDSGFVAVFQVSDGVRRVSVAKLPPCETAFATTIHRAQGSEFDDVWVVLPNYPSAVLTRELLYTAVTRAKKSVTIVGTPAIIAFAMANKEDRTGGLQDRLLNGLG